MDDLRTYRNDRVVRPEQAIEALTKGRSASCLTNPAQTAASPRANQTSRSFARTGLPTNGGGANGGTSNGGTSNGGTSNGGTSGGGNQDTDLIQPYTGETGTYVIRRGETLADVARQFNITLEELLTLNPDVNPYYYRAGDVLIVPQCNTDVEDECCSGTLYCVKQGDSIASIADAFGVTVDALYAANYVLTQIGLIAGQIICIPEARTECPDIEIDVCPGASMQVTVQEGQTVSDLLIEHNISFNALVALNPTVDFMNLQAGQLLCIAPRDSRGTCLDCDAVYTIRQGDTLESISDFSGVSVEELLSMNPTLLPSEFIAGQLICLP